MDQAFALIVLAFLAVKGLADTLTFTEALLVAFIFLCLFLMWWSHDCVTAHVTAAEPTGNAD
jgi:hypothetical protein